MAETAAYSIRGYSGSAAATTLSAGITAADTTITVTSGASYAGLTNFRITINQGESTEEEVEVASVSGNTFQNCVRGVGGTTAAAHTSGESVEHTSSKRDFEEANKAVNETIGQVTAANQVLVSDAANSFTALDVAASRILGRAAAGGVDDLTAAQVKTILALASADISDLAEFIRDTMGTALVAGSNVTLTVNDAGDTITVASGASAAFVGAKGNRATSAQAIANNTWTSVEMNAESFDSDAFHDTGTNPSRFTIPAGKAGKYLVVARAEFVANATGRRILAIAVDGTRMSFVELAPPGATNAIAGEISALLNLSVGNYVELQVFQTSGGALNVNLGAGTTDLSLHLVGT